MESHVSGGITPLGIGELRQAISAVIVGSPLFTEEEQLLASHMTDECDDPERLERWLRNVRRQDVERGTRARMLAALDANQQSVCLDKETHLAELSQLMRGNGLNRWQKDLVLSLMTSAGRRVGDRLQWLGHSWLDLLGNLGRIPKKKAFAALLDN
jgi:hypothetical protein